MVKKDIFGFSVNGGNNMFNNKPMKMSKKNNGVFNGGTGDFVKGAFGVAVALPLIGVGLQSLASVNN